MRRTKLFTGDQRGSALVDAMFGIVVTGLTVIALAGIIDASSNALTHINSQNARTAYLTNLVNEKTGNPQSVPTAPASTLGPIPGDVGQTTVTMWRTDGPGIATIHAAAPVKGQTGCTDPANLTGCLTTSVDVLTIDPGIQTTNLNPEWDHPGIDTASGATVPAGQLGTFRIPDGSHEARFVFNLNSGTGPGAIEFQVNGAPAEAVLYDETDQTSFYGSVFADPGTTVTIIATEVNPNTTVNLSRFYLYEGAR